MVDFVRTVMASSDDIRQKYRRGRCRLEPGRSINVVSSAFIASSKDVSAEMASVVGGGNERRTSLRDGRSLSLAQRRGLRGGGRETELRFHGAPLE